MAIPSLPTPLDQLGNRSFSFFPPILGIESNEWLFRRATRPEVLITNADTGLQIAIPRRFVGEVSRVEEPVVIVGLLKELEYREGQVWPHQRRILQMPVAVGAESMKTSAAPRSRGLPAPVIGISLHASRQSRRSRTLIGAIVAAILALLVIAGAVHEARPRITHLPR
ncbi:MAG: hypothetical protein M3Z09_06770 [Acidobacteriota bacterium]|nr:hypothetical protein [Acidobacteriota bacterium]